MPYPDKPNIQTSYTAYEQSLGDGSMPGQELDNDFANLADSVESLNDFVRGITRSDGALKNGLVTQESLAASVRIGIDPPTTWATATPYTVGRSTVFSGFGFYVCAASHTSGASFAADNGAGRWTLLADLTPPTGTLLRDLNLSDVANAATARTNLGVSLGNLGVTATAGELNALDGVTILGTNIVRSPDPATARIFAEAAPWPRSTPGIGQWATIAPAFGAAYSVPAGGEWAFVAFIINSNGQMIDAQVFTGVVAGGTPIWVASPGNRIVGIAYRIR